ncbi:putative bifunctional diguanylate cyclase/phosphodiesterase [Raoultibacter phocaeensis]|uniref:putative bifunctional diguanylate cyclase/phosphodiesterase n=1 Tax=Raoultibacter phocaeensis TaxID=2479841 RepID=UPI001117B945|nr:GGDEF domain-containing protein [Raoultibacter phocaeensis]
MPEPQQVKLDTVDDEYDILINSLGVSVSRHLLDEHFTVIWANDNYYSFFGYTKAEYEALFENQCDRFFVGYEDEWNRIGVIVRKALAQGDASYSCIVSMPCKDGSSKWIKLIGTFTSLTADGYPVAYTVMTDVGDLMNTQHELLEERRKLETLAFVDPVTGGLNRTRFDIDVRTLLDQSEPNEYALVSLDLKKFKLLNDMFGIENGDLMLAHINRSIAAHLHDGELVGRMASDEFNILMAYESDEKTVERLDAMARAMNDHNSRVDQPFNLTFVAGIYVIDRPSLSVTVVRDRANVARKNVHGILREQEINAAFYSDDDRIALVREKGMENRMYDALGGGEFSVYLQPKVQLSSGEIAGAEALVRWIEPEGTIVPPNEFIALFERNGFIVELDLYVFEQVCKALRRWIDQGRSPVPISVNMSRIHFNEPDFLDRYEEIRLRYGVAPHFLEFEFTESIVFDGVEEFEEIVAAIHALGYRCSMDDFGSGFSSLNTLKDIDVDVLKLDRAFFMSEEDIQDRGWAVVSSVIDLAEKLDMETVAEGIEQTVQVERLRDTACTMVQGYVFHRPVPLSEFERLLFER